MLNVTNDDTFYSPEDLAKRFKLSLASIYKLVRSGEIPSIRLGKVYRISGSDLRQYLLQQRLRSRVPQRPIPETAKKFVELLRASPLKNRVEALYLYGSYARGDFDVESDIDLCLVVDRVDWQLEQTIASMAEKAMAATEYQELLCVRSEGSAEWQRMQDERYPLVQNINREGISLWNRP